MDLFNKKISWNYLTSPEGLARGTGRALGSIASIALPTALTEGASLGLTGATLAARGGALLSRIPGISKAAGEWATRGLMTVPTEAAMEAGNFEKNAIANGMSPSEAARRSWGVFGRNAGFLALSNALQFGMLPKPAGKGVSLGRRGLTAGAELGTQALEETYQEGIHNEMTGKPYTYNPMEMMSNPKYAEQAQAMKEGFLGMAPFMLGGAGAGYVRDKIADEKERATYDPNFTDKQNQIWKLANYASARAKSKFNYNISAALIYKQWAHESYENFDSKMARLDNNYGGLKDTSGNWRSFGSDKEFADAYVDDFIRRRPELNGITDIEEFATTMADTGYFPHAELSDYITGMKNAKIPHSSTGNSSAGKRKDETRIDEFMQALAGQESGGDYNAYNGMYGASGKFQILPDNWAQWASDAGLSPNAEMTPENQDLVAKNKMLEYYKKFGDWRKVAEAWYGGEGAVSWSAEAKARKQADGYPSINEYADSVMARFENILSSREDEDEGAEIEITPEMIEKAKGKYWIEQGTVSYEGAQPQTMQALYLLGKWFYKKTGSPLVVSAVTNGSHADGEFSHANGWKIDLHDGGSGAEGALITDDYHAGTLFNEFVEYGRSLGLGMNFEGEGTSNVHFDIAVDGTDWMAGKHYGGFNGGKVKRTKNSKNIVSTAETSNDDDSVIDGIIKNRLTSEPNATPTFDATKDNRKLEKEVFKIFVEDKKNNSEGEDAASFMNFLQDHKMLKDDGTFKNSAKNRELLRQEFGEEIQEYGENKVAESYNKFMESQKSADEKIRSAFEEVVRKEEEGSDS